MCICAAPAQAMGGTISITLMPHPERQNELWHTYAFQQATRSDKINWDRVKGFLPTDLHDSIRNAGSNAMILPLPTREEVGPWNVIDLSNPDKPGELPGFSDILNEQISAVNVEGCLGVHGGSASVFRVGIYHVVASNDPLLSWQAIERYIDPDKRPPYRYDLIEQVHARYRFPDGTPWPVFWACFNTADLRQQAEDNYTADPFMVTIRPYNPWAFFIPMLRTTPEGTMPTGPEKGVATDRYTNLVFGIKDLDPEVIAAMTQNRVFGKTGTSTFADNDANQVNYLPIKDPKENYYLRSGGSVSPKDLRYEKDGTIKKEDRQLVYHPQDFIPGLYLPSHVKGVASSRDRIERWDMWTTVDRVINGTNGWIERLGAHWSTDSLTMKLKSGDTISPFTYRPKFKPDYDGLAQRAEGFLSDALAQYGQLNEDGKW